MSRKSAAGRRRVGGAERRIRAAAYFLSFIPVFLGFELVIRGWALGWSRLRPAGRRDRFNRLIHLWAEVLRWLTERLLLARIERRGDLPEGRFVVVSNHQSTADIVFLISALRPLNCKFVAKRELGKWIPTVSVYLQHAGSALVSREGSREDLQAIARLGQSLEAWNGSAVVFAEGTRSRDGRMGTYRPAGVRVLVRESGLPVLPVCIDGTHAAADLSRFATGMLGARVTIVVGEPVKLPASGAEFQEGLAAIERWTEETLKALRADAGDAAPLRGQAGSAAEGVAT